MNTNRSCIVILLSLSALCLACENESSSEVSPSPDVGAPVDTQLDAGAAIELDAAYVDAASPDQDIPADEPNYDLLAHWLCHPEKADGVCRENLDITQVNADGSTELIPFLPNPNAEVDCFYVYPTASMDQAPNADMLPGIGETTVTKVQAARFQQYCRLFAPIYRQTTISTLVTGNAEADYEMAYEDVVLAFEHYMDHENAGRPILFLGHSQGAEHLGRLLAERYDSNADQRANLVGAVLPGSEFQVPIGQRAGGNFENIPLCQSEGEWGCLITYVTFRATSGPVEVSPFGHSLGEGLQAACANPAALGGGRAPIHGVYPTGSFGGFDNIIVGNRYAFADPARQSEITTALFSLPGLAEAECVSEDGFSYLQIHVTADPGDPRADDIGGDIVLSPYGLHLVDMNVVLLDLEARVQAQIQAYLNR